MSTSFCHPEHSSHLAGALAFQVIIVTFTEKAPTAPRLFLYLPSVTFSPVRLLDLLFLLLWSCFSLQMALVISLCLIMLKPRLLRKLFSLISPTIWNSLFFPPLFLSASLLLHLLSNLIWKHLMFPCLCLLISLSLCYYVLFNFDKYLGMPFVWNKFY